MALHRICKEGIHKMIIIQRIIVEWTKKSRGGIGAKRRSQIDEALRIPPTSDSTSTYVFHNVRIAEWFDFNEQATMETSSAKKQLETEPLNFHVAAGVLKTRFCWSREHCGAPSRESRDLFVLSKNQWARFVCNGRFSKDLDTGEWTYHKTVFNISNEKQFDEELFLRGTPSTIAKSLSTLS
jgi:hypothetical protein